MKFKAALKYQLSSMTRPLIVFYVVIYSLLILMTVLQLTSTVDDGNVSFGGMDFASVIFLFVTGLNSFKSTFHLMLANGVSRRTMFHSFSVMALPLAAGMAIIDTINGIIFSNVYNYQSMFKQFYRLRYVTEGPAGNSVQVVAEGVLWMFFLYASVAMIGYLITTLYYRMNKPLKLVVSIGVPVFLIILLPIIDNVWLPSVDIYGGIVRFFRWAWGFANGGCNPYIAMITSAITFGVCGVLSFLVSRNATVKLS